MANWTNEQYQAITAKDSTLLVAAAAGSGKTAVLVERIIQRICDPKDPIDVDRLLVVTFTSLAAAEMKERIGVAIEKALKENPLSRHLYRQSTLLNKASITTLHSFCLEIVRENFYRIGIDPNFRIADDTEAQLLRLDVLEELLEIYYQQSQEGDDFIKLMDSYGGQRDDGPIQDLIIKLHQFSRSNPWPDYWLDSVVESFETNDWFQEILPSITMELEGARALLLQSYKHAQEPKGPQGYLVNIKDELAYLEDLINSSKHSWQKLYETFPLSGFKRLPRVKKEQVDEGLQEKVKDLREKAKGKVRDIQGKYFLRPPQELLEDLTHLKPYLKILCQLVKDFQEGYKKRKAKGNLVDFNDLEHYCLEILLGEDSQPDLIIPSEVSLKLRERFVEVLVDEYQDINDVQETILTLVAGPSNMFMVGDVKQSIYRFRLAKPELFLRKYKSFSLDSLASHRRIDLSKNFRCSLEIVDGVNYIFTQMMTPTVGEISYDDKAKLVYGATPLEGCTAGLNLGAPIEVHLIEKKAGEQEEEELEPLEREAQVIGQQILEMIKGGYLVFDKELNCQRPITYRDIVILYRSPRGTVERLMERFHHLGIPVYAQLGSGYFSAIEVQTILALLKIIDNPRQDIPLAAVLRSPLLGLSGEELAQIRLTEPNGTFYSAVVKASQGDDNQLALRIRGFLEQLDRWRTIARQGSLADLIWTLYRDTGYLDYVGSMVGGAQRQGNLRALHDRARQYEATSFRGLFRFLRFLERIEENKGDMEGAKALSENENVVRVMSIHKSKGLEFPVVFVGGLGKKFNLRDGQQDIVIHKDLGLGPVFIDGDRRIKYPTIAKLAIENRSRLETLAEEMRVLYVALTRAKERLILVGSTNNLSDQIENWCQILDYQGESLPDSQLAQGQTFLHWLGPTLIRHKDLAVLRNQVGYGGVGYLIDHKSRWLVRLYTEGDFAIKEQEVAATLEETQDIKGLTGIVQDSSWQEIVDKRLSWQYPYNYLLGKGAKVTVTEIKHKFHQYSQGEEFKPYYGFSKRPTFLQREKGPSPQEKGTALHLVMEHINLGRVITEEYLDELLASLEARELLTSEQMMLINKEYILNFLQGPLGQRLQKATQVKREVPFSLSLPAYEVYDIPEAGGDKVLLQGVIDCMWWEEPGWILLDYKSDVVPKGSLAEAVRKYTGQINLYTRAIETSMKSPVLERYIHFFYLDQTVEV